MAPSESDKPARPDTDQPAPKPPDDPVRTREPVDPCREKIDPEWDDDILDWQHALKFYLDAELEHTAGAYMGANRKLEMASAWMDALPPGAGGELRRATQEVVRAAITLNGDLLGQRYAATLDYRCPAPPRLSLGDGNESRPCAFYVVAGAALQDDDLQDDGREPDDSLRVIGDAILLNLERSVDRSGAEREDKERLRKRYRHRRDRASEVLGDAESASSAGLDAPAFRYASLGDRGGVVVAEVLLALAQAHLHMHDVEHRRSQPVGRMLDRDGSALDEERRLLQRAVILTTASYATCDALPWIFAADEEERQMVERDPGSARRDVRPGRPLWLARQVIMLSLYRRAHAFRLLREPERAHADLRKVQRIGRLTESGVPRSDLRYRYVDVLEALCDYRVGELYRADHDYMRALVYLCRSHDRLGSLLLLSASSAKQDDDSKAGEGHGRKMSYPQLEMTLRLRKGQSFFEVGAFKRALKWFFRTWYVLQHLTAEHPYGRHQWVPEFPQEAEYRELTQLDDYLERVKHDPELDAGNIRAFLQSAVGWICTHDVPDAYKAMAANVLGRIGHLLMVFRLERDAASAVCCIRRAADLDPRNLLVRTGVQRLRLNAIHAGFSEPPEVLTRENLEALPSAMDCWPSGPSDVDQAIRVGEHLMLRSLVDAERDGTDDPDVEVARKLTGRFVAHTDSINLRLDILNRYLMRERVEEHQPELAEDAPTESYLEFVSLRRYGCFTPLLPRPAAVSAVGGGYLVRVCMPTTNEQERRQDVFNILIDPGEGVVTNLYRVGLGIADINLVVATHDHPDHLSALDAILSLRNERARVSREPLPTLRLLGNQSVVSRYGYLPEADLNVQLLGEHRPIDHGEGTSELRLSPLRAAHKDLGNNDAIGCLLSFARDPSAAELRIAFMSDTAVEGTDGNGIGSYSNNRRTELETHDENWRKAFESDIVVAHVSNVSSGELVDLAQLPLEPRDGDAFTSRVEKLRSRGRSKEAVRLESGLTGGSEHRRLLERGFIEATPAVEETHLYLHGLLAVAKQMARRTARPGVLVVGELREQLGSFRGKIATEINHSLLKRDDVPSAVALTADIGLRIRLDSAGSRVLCSRCSLNNDRLDDERFHPPAQMVEVCVKGDHEANYWMCDRHNPAAKHSHPTDPMTQADPTAYDPPLFIEQLSGYNPFATGDRYYG